MDAPPFGGDHLRGALGPRDTMGRPADETALPLRGFPSFLLRWVGSNFMADVRHHRWPPSQAASFAPFARDPNTSAEGKSRSRGTPAEAEVRHVGGFRRHA